MSKTIPAIMSKPLDMATKLKLCAEIMKAENVTDLSLFQAGFTYAKIKQAEKRNQIQELSMEEKRNPPKLLKRFDQA